jgi:mono/diheme cytochrome c family protein
MPLGRINEIVTLTGMDMFPRLMLPVLVSLLAVVGDVGAQPIHQASRGELLYTTHCIACHDTQVHWREKKLVTDDKSLRREVNRWQDVAGLGWTGQDVEEVAQYLRALYYRHLTPN